MQRARDALIALGQHASIDAIRDALGNTGSHSAASVPGCTNG
ncbi:DNA-binding protein [Burkholderia sp. MR1-5-21]